MEILVHRIGFILAKEISEVAYLNGKQIQCWSVSDKTPTIKSKVLEFDVLWVYGRQNNLLQIGIIMTLEPKRTCKNYTHISFSFSLYIYIDIYTQVQKPIVLF